MNGFVYWKDYDTMAKNVKWASVWDGKDYTKVTQIQGGQLLYDRNKVWKLIHAAKYQCMNHQYYFRHMFGDQDTLRVALSCGRMTDYKKLDSIAWKKVAFICSYGMTPYIVHRCQGKLFAPQDIPKGRSKYANPQYDLPLETTVFDLFKDVVAKYTPNDATVFDKIYERQLWGNANPSGAGSTLAEGQLFIDYVNRIHYNYNLRSVIDVGCGTGVIGDKLLYDKYLGLDASKIALQHARKNHPSNDYALVDFANVEDIPDGDSLICKDVLHHWPTEVIVKWLKDITDANRWRYLILCQDDNQLTDDCYMGGYRALSPDKFPLNQYTYEHRAKVHHKTLLVLKLKG